MVDYREVNSWSGAALPSLSQWFGRPRWTLARFPVPGPLGRSGPLVTDDDDEGTVRSDVAAVGGSSARLTRAASAVPATALQLICPMNRGDMAFGGAARAAPAVPSSGPQFSSDEAGDGPAGKPSGTPKAGKGGDHAGGPAVPPPWPKAAAPKRGRTYV